MIWLFEQIGNSFFSFSSNHVTFMLINFSTFFLVFDIGGLLVGALLENIHVTILYSIPSTFIVIMFTLIFWGADYKQIWKRSLFFSVLQPLIGDITIDKLQPSLHIIIFLICYYVFFQLFFTQFSRTERTIMFIFSYICIVFNELVATLISLPAYSSDNRFDLDNYFLLYVWPTIIVYGIIAFVLVKKKIHPGITVLQFLKKRSKSPMMLIAIFLFIQFILAMIIIFQLFDTGDFSGQVSFFTIIIFELLTLITFFAMLRMISVVKENTVTQTQDVFLTNIESMFTTIRGQRHDFLNHVQVLRAMIERNKMDDFMRYSKDLLGEIDEVNEMIHIGHPAISALIQSKTARSLSEKIKFSYEFTGLSQLKSSVKTIDIVKIMGNLLDNAFDEAAALPSEQRYVEISGSVENGLFQITVKNPLKTRIDTELYDLFNSGYSTKDKERHSGLGLTIVKEYVERYKGKVSVENQSGNEIIFRVTLAL